MNQTCKTYRKQAFVGFFLYTVVAGLSIAAISRYHLGVWRLPVAASPLLPALLIVRSVVRMFTSCDELQVRINLQALAFAFTATALITLTYGFLQNAGLPTANWVWVWPLMGSLLLVGKVFTKRKYQ